jgi:hypothetical protein
MNSLRFPGSDFFERHGPSGKSYRDTMSMPQGWPYLLQQFQKYCHRLSAGESPSPHLPFEKRALNEDEEYQETKKSCGSDSCSG